MKFAKSLGVFLISIILIFSLFLLSFSIILSSFLYPAIYTETFEKAGVYDFIENNLEKSGSAIFIAIPNGTRPLVEELLTNFLDYLRSDKNKLDLSVKIDTAKLNSFFTEPATALKQCAPNQDPFNEENPCLPNGKNVSEFIGDFLRSKNLSFFEKDRVDLAEVYGINEGSEGREIIDNAREYITSFKFSQIIFTIFIIVSLYLIYLLQKPNIKKFFRTVSIDFIVIFTILTSIILAIKSIPEYLLTNNQALLTILKAILSILNEKLFVHSGVVIAVAIILFIVSFIIKNKNIEKNKLMGKKK